MPAKRSCVDFTFSSLEPEASIPIPARIATHRPTVMRSRCQSIVWTSGMWLNNAWKRGGVDDSQCHERDNDEANCLRSTPATDYSQHRECDTDQPHICCGVRVHRVAEDLVPGERQAVVSLHEQMHEIMGGKSLAYLSRGEQCSAVSGRSCQHLQAGQGSGAESAAPATAAIDKSISGRTGAPSSVLRSELHDQHREDEDDDETQPGWRRSLARRNRRPARIRTANAATWRARCSPRTIRMATANSQPAHDITAACGHPSHPMKEPLSS